MYPSVNEPGTLDTYNFLWGAIYFWQIPQKKKTKTQKKKIIPHPFLMGYAPEWLETEI